jgi:thiol-disulfide isomerase/thioredoxin
VKTRTSYLATATLAVGILLAAFALYIWVSGRKDHSSLDRIALSGRSADPMVGKPAPELSLTALDGSVVDLGELRGHPVVINYWATWCDPCRAEMPLLQSRYEEYAPDLYILGVNAGEDQADVSKFVADLALTFPVLLDKEYKAEAAFGIMAYPATVFVDSNGMIQARQIGQLDSRLLDAYLKLIGVGN